MDGLMFDTERISKTAWGIAGKECGTDRGEELIYFAFGRSKAESMIMLREHCGADFPGARFFDRVNQIKQEIIAKEGLPVKTGLYKLLDFLKENNVRIAIATSTHRELTMEYLQMAHLEGCFDVIATGDMVTRGKPSPDIFLKACELLHAAPSDCLVLEDSINGIHAAVNGGLLPFMIPDMVQPDSKTLSLLAGMGKTLLDVIVYIQNH